MRIDVRSRQDPGRLLGHLDLAHDEIPPGTEALHLAETGPGHDRNDGEVTVPVSFRKATPDMGKWIAWADAPEDLDGTQGYSRAGGEAG
jgi:hypothetical protein